jgi:hypothetical protein
MMFFTVELHHNETAVFWDVTLKSVPFTILDEGQIQQSSNSRNLDILLNKVKTGNTKIKETLEKGC